MTKKQRNILDTYLTEYPQNWSIEQVIDGILKKSSEIIIWGPFEYDSPEHLIKRIREVL